MPTTRTCAFEGCDWLAHTGWFCGKHKEHNNKAKKIQKEEKKKIVDCTSCFAGKMVKRGIVRGKQRTQCNNCKHYKLIEL